MSYTHCLVGRLQLLALSHHSNQVRHRLPSQQQEMVIPMAAHLPLN